MPENSRYDITLLADAGGTGISWALLQGAKKATNNYSDHPNHLTFNTEGFHPYHNDDQKLLNILETSVKTALAGREPEKIVYYGTGCSNPEMSSRVAKILNSVFQHTDILVHHDMLAAARATCGRKPGIACILGTGSNSCLYDGEQIVQQQISLGYILGDEGSGAHLGKRILREMLYNEHPKDLTDSFFDFTSQKYGTQDLLSLLYRSGEPSRFLASLVPFIAANIHIESMRKIAVECFTAFFDMHVLQYPQNEALPVHFSGGLSLAFKDIISAICNERNLVLGRFLDNPLHDLMEYHLTE